MAERNLELWSSWIQSPHIIVACAAGEVLIPRELLRRRSPCFQRTIDEQERGEGAKRISLEEMEFTTLKCFHRWCVKENPSLGDDITPSTLLDLGIFAVKYEVFALEHRVADIFHERLHKHSGRDPWVLRGDMVARIYRECLPSCCLRRVFCNALTSLSPRQVVDEWSEWSRFAAPDGGEILLDIIKAMAKTAVGMSDARNQSTLYRSMSSSLYDPCQFHDHLRQGFLLANAQGDFGRLFKTECSFRNVECFPDENVVSENFAAVGGREAATATKEDGAMILEEALASAEVEQASCDEPAVKERAASCDDPRSFNGDSDSTTVREYSLSDEDYDSYDETCQNNMQDIDDLMSEWQSNQ
ncbi:hypothetical protein LTR96_011100 [Exophiala xenobiotica]|nr:hypothetical protein LTR72_011417 [Exophiala xenobiotica]KAK5263516.1 hypothetical protein LTR96_011100 [Exophiala xenobiotica]KAK5284884.1 hypothetical protein LTR14_011414 [Exophiala xenobiotica]KAK5332760.1 hypothetical protein LTR98_011132 [Exophiala xenobiotica]KAK5469033.1 hypothetical protein LTR55_011439 [Exophiala xenobiotica]